MENGLAGTVQQPYDWLLLAYAVAQGLARSTVECSGGRNVALSDRLECRQHPAVRVAMDSQHTTIDSTDRPTAPAQSSAALHTSLNLRQLQPSASQPASYVWFQPSSHPDFRCAAAAIWSRSVARAPARPPLATSRLPPLHAQFAAAAVAAAVFGLMTPLLTGLPHDPRALPCTYTVGHTLDEVHSSRCCTPTVDGSCTAGARHDARMLVHATTSICSTQSPHAHEQGD